MRSAASGQRSAISDEIHLDSRGGVARWLCRVASLIVSALVGVLWLALLAWLIGRICTDRWLWSQWLWWIPTPAALIVAAMGWLFAFRGARTKQRRRCRIILWSCCGAAITLHFALFEQRLMHAASTPPPNALTIAHWNMATQVKTDDDAILQSLESLDSDILLMTSPPGLVRQRMYDVAAAADGTGSFLNIYPVCIRSRLPIIHSRILVATDFMFVTLIEIDASAKLGRHITLYAVDFPSNPRRPRMPIAREVRRLLDELDAPPPDLIVGDFNITRDSASIATMFPNSTDAFNVAGHGYGATFPRRLPLYHIDHVLVSDASGLRAARYDIVDEGQSRHRAQKAWIELAASTSGG